MCGSSSPSIPVASSSPVVAPTYADAKVSKSTAATRNKTSMLAGRNIKTSSRGLDDEVKTNKKSLLGD